jgi:hypothetical protein
MRNKPLSCCGIWVGLGHVWLPPYMRMTRTLSTQKLNGFYVVSTKQNNDMSL